MKISQMEGKAIGPHDMGRRLGKRHSSKVGRLNKDNPRLDPLEGSEFLCLRDILKGPGRVRPYLRITKMKGINFDWQMATENKYLTVYGSSNRV